MGIILSATTERLLQQSNISTQLILEIEGLPSIGALTIKKVWYIGNDAVIGQPGLLIGGLVDEPNQYPYISLAGTTKSFTQQINQDKGTGTSVTNVKIEIVDKNGAISNMVAPNVYVSDVLGKSAVLYLSVDGAAHPGDSVIVLSGIVDSIEFASGMVSISVSHPEQLKRQEIFFEHKDVCSTVLAGDATVTVLAADNILPTTINCQPFVQIEDEIMRVGSILGNTMLVVRGQFGTIAVGHSSGSEVSTIYQIDGNAIDLVCSLYASGSGYHSDTDIISISELRKITFSGSTTIGKLGLVAGDFIQIADSVNALNNGVWTISSTGIDGDSSWVKVTVDLIDEELSVASAQFKSKYDTLPDGAALDGRYVDFERFEYLKTITYSGFPDFTFYLKEKINVRDFVEQEIMLPIGLYSVPRSGKISASMTLPPISNVSTIFIDEDNLISIKNIKPTRSINKNLYNAVVYRYDEDIVTEKFTKGYLLTSEDSNNRIKVGNKPLVIDAKGLRLGCEAYITAQAQRYIDRYQFAAEQFEVEINYKSGLALEVGDIIVFGSTNIPIADSRTGEKGLEPRMMEIVNKSLDFVAGKIKLVLLDTAYQVASRYGTISPSSKVVSSTPTSVLMADSEGMGVGELEKKKWLSYIGETLYIRNDDGSYIESNRLLGFDPSNENVMLFSNAFGTNPPANSVVHIPDYNAQSTKFKQVFCSLGLQIDIVSGVSTTQFTVSLIDVSKLFVGSNIEIVLISDFSTTSGIRTITDITGQTVTVDSTMGFTPDNTYTCVGIGFLSDEDPAYSIY